jgi:hypothetical protein
MSEQDRTTNVPPAYRVLDMPTRLTLPLTEEAHI